jgi:hypothetical protein
MMRAKNYLNNCFKFCPCLHLHYKCVYCLLLSSCYIPLSVGVADMAKTGDTAIASSACPSFTGPSRV